jgi:soluble lytic murein transglycosylase-like protein
VAALILALAIAATPSARVAQWQPLIDGASRRFGVPSEWIASVMTAESGGQTTIGGIPIRSRAGAIGLMQLMPATWGDLRNTYSLGRNPDDPADNIAAGSAYLRQLYDRFGYPGLFAAYNAGPARYADYLAGKSGLPIETRAYLAKVTGTAPGGPVLIAAAPTIFVLRHDRDGLAPPTDRDQPASLFAVGEASR